jgi:hypothetical protein
VLTINPYEEEGNTNFLGLNHKHNEVIEGEGEVLLLESMAHSRELKSSLKNKNKNQDLDLREREESSSFGSQGSLLSF